MKTIAILIITLAASPTYAKVYKCIVKEQTRYQQAPCPKESSRDTAIELIPNIVSTKGLRRYMELDKKPKKRREKKARDAKKAKRSWMNQEVDTYAKKVDKTNTLKRRQKIKKEKERARRRSRVIY